MGRLAWAAAAAASVAVLWAGGSSAGSSTSTILFERVDATSDIYTLDVDSGQLRRLTTHSADFDNYAWLSDRVLTYFDYHGRMWSVARGGGRPRLLPGTFWPNSGTPDIGGFDWSSDGRLLAYSVNGGIRIYDRRTEKSRLLTKPSSGDNDPAWAPNGRTIAFERRSELHTIPVAGGPIKNLGAGEEPSWSPDGRELVVVDACAACDGNKQLFVVEADGGSRRRLMNDNCWDVYPAWSPRGAISFTALCSGDSLAVVAPDGTGRRTLTTAGTR